MACGGGGSNTTHALLSPDPETLPMGEVSRPATGEFLGTKGIQGQPTVASYAPFFKTSQNFSVRNSTEGMIHTAMVCTIVLE